MTPLVPAEQTAGIVESDIVDFEKGSLEFARYTNAGVLKLIESGIGVRVRSLEQARALTEIVS